MKKFLHLTCAAVVASACSLPLMLNAQPVDDPGRPEIIFHPPNPHFGAAPTAGSTSAVKPAIAYHGGPIMATPNIYVIWYGNWNNTTGSDTPTGQAIVRSFLGSLGGSEWFNINASYPGVTGGASFVAGPTGETGYPNPSITAWGYALSDASIQAIVADAIPSLGGGAYPNGDPNGIYLVLTSSDVTATSGFCTQYCGWHTHGSINSKDIKYSFVGNSARCLSACAAQSVSPNGNPGVDGMISVIAHEVSEATTDPDLNAWWDNRGYENADKCAWTFGTTTLLPGGAYYNVTLNSKNYLIQRNLYRASSTANYCVKGVNGASLTR